MDAEANAQAPAVAADDHVSPRKRRKVNHGITVFTVHPSSKAVADTLG